MLRKIFNDMLLECCKIVILIKSQDEEIRGEGSKVLAAALVTLNHSATGEKGMGTHGQDSAENRPMSLDSLRKGAGSPPGIVPTPLHRRLRIARSWAHCPLTLIKY